jgi:hypothetical protein
MKVMTCVLLYAALLLAGCSKGTPQLTTSASFNQMRNKSLCGRVVPMGEYDKKILIEGIPDSDFAVAIDVSWKAGDAEGSSGAEIEFRWTDDRLMVQPDDCQLSGGGERPAIRRESDNEWTIYYPVELCGRRSWVKFCVIMQKPDSVKRKGEPASRGNRQGAT